MDLIVRYRESSIHYREKHLISGFKAAVVVLMLVCIWFIMRLQEHKNLKNRIDIPTQQCLLIL